MGQIDPVTLNTHNHTGIATNYNHKGSVNLPTHTLIMMYDRMRSSRSNRSRACIVCVVELTCMPLQ